MKDRHLCVKKAATASVVFKPGSLGIFWRFFLKRGEMGGGQQKRGNEEMQTIPTPRGHISPRRVSVISSNKFLWPRPAPRDLKCSVHTELWFPSTTQSPEESGHVRFWAGGPGTLGLA